MSQKATLLTALPAPQGPQFLEVNRVLSISSEGREYRGELVNVTDIRGVSPSCHADCLQFSTSNEILTVVSTIKSFKEALNFLRQNPSRASVVLRETWDGRAREPSLDDLDEILPDEKATRV
jgi:hypothetical protein